MERLAKQVALGVGVGLGILASSATLYLLLKSDEDDEGLGGGTFKSIRPSSAKIKVPKDVVGSVIGRGGEVIKQIQQSTNTKINFDDGNDEEERTMVIRGSPDDVVEAEMLVKKIIANKPVKEEIWIPADAVGYVIGKSGETVRGICGSSGAKVTIPKNVTKGNLQQVVIRGTDSQIEAAKALINEKIVFSEKRNQFKNNNPTTGATRESIAFRERYLAIEAIEEGHTDEQKSGNKGLNAFVEKHLPITDDGSYVQVFVSSVKNPNKFWIQPFGTKAIDLDKLVDDMTDFYRVESNRILMKLNTVNIDEVVAAPYGHDTNWYRVRIVEIMDEGYPMEEADIKVYYLDFGDEGIVKRKDLCALTTDFARRLMFQANECSLHGVQPVDDTWSEEAIKYFNEITYAAQWTYISAKAIHQTEANKSLVTSVDLVDALKDINIGDAMVNKGFAVRVDSS